MLAHPRQLRFGAFQAGAVSSPGQRSLWNGILLFALSLVLLGAGLYILGDTAAILFQAEVSQAWPTTRASVQTVRPSGFGSRGIEAQYSYRVAGIAYGGTAVDLPHLSAGQLYDAARLGQSISVHYNPRSPEISVLDPGFTWTSALWSLWGLLYLAGGIAGLWVSVGLEARVRRGRLRHAA
jgi:Protein of unknown function (DUF3592)